MLYDFIEKETVCILALNTLLLGLRVHFIVIKRVNKGVIILGSTVHTAKVVNTG